MTLNNDPRACPWPCRAGELEAFYREAGQLRNVYWRIRDFRSQNLRRQWYRYAAKEKGRLAALGYDSEVIRLYALYLRDPRREKRLERFLEAFEESINGPRQLQLFA